MPSGHQPSPSVPGAPGQTPTSSAGLLALIADVERQLSSLREADAQRQVAEEALAARESAAEELEQRAQVSLRENETLAEQLRVQREEIDAETARVQAEREALSAERLELESQRVELERELERISELERIALETRTAAESARQQAAEQAASAQQAAEEADRKRSQMERTLAERAAAFRAAEERMEQRATDASAMIAEAQSLADGHASRIRSLESDLQAAKAEASKLAADLQDKSHVIASRNEELKTLRAQAATLRERSGGDSQLKKQVAELQEAQVRALAEADSMRAALATSEAKASEYLRHIAEVEGQLAEAQKALEAAGTADPSVDGEVRGQLEALTLARDEAMADAAKLREFARTLGQELAAARAASEQGGSMGPEPTDAFVAARRRRLLRQRKLLRGQSEKIKRAGEAVRERFEQVEQILTQRAELIAARKSVEEAKRKLRSRQARGGALAAIFYVSMAMLIYAGVGWVVAQNVAPAVYAVTAQVQADGSGRPLSAAELDEWQRYHEELMTDPRFMEVASEKLKQRGIASLASPTALKDRLGRDLTLITDAPGSLTIELRGLGAEKTKRELDTIVTTFVRTANAARERRVDGSNTIIAAQPAAAEAPLYDERIYYAGGIAGGLTLLSSLAAFVLWRKLYEAKASIERTDEFDGLMDERRWQMPTRPS